MRLEDYVRVIEDQGAGGEITLEAPALPTPNLVANLRHLKNLGVLSDETIWALVGQAPIDPIGLFAVLRNRGTWAFQPLDFTMLQILAKREGTPVALLRIDLMSDDMTFVVMKNQVLVEEFVVTAEETTKILAQPHITEDKVLIWLHRHMKRAIDIGTSAS